jgi:hypothetical protein
VKLTKSQLKQLIKEEITKSIHEGEDPMSTVGRDTEWAPAGASPKKRFTGGQVDVEPMSSASQDEHRDAYYELYHFLVDSGLPGNKPSEKMLSALSWIARFELGPEAE